MVRLLKEMKEKILSCDAEINTEYKNAIVQGFSKELLGRMLGGELNVSCPTTSNQGNSKASAPSWMLAGPCALLSS